MGAIPTNTNNEKTERTLCSSCNDLKQNSAIFTRRGVTEEVCESLGKDTGFNPESDNDTCTVLKLANDCLIRGKIEELPLYDNCDWKCFMEEYLKNQYTMNEAMICAICGLQEQIYGMYSMFWEVNTRFNVAQATQGMKMEIDRQGNWHYHHDDWDQGNGVGERYGYGDMFGTIDFCMGNADNAAAMWKINSVTVSRYKYTFIRSHTGQTPPVVTLRIPDKGNSVIYQKTLDKSFEDQINKTISYTKGGTIESGKDSGWITFAHVFTDWTQDDEGTFQIKFVNGAKTAMKSC
ncbi:hypothetical protein [Faecalibaculum rodentium]|uniref:hypothetical protein n=1 Tax=Faecalibaculum rodentium TaxID=1702221 RepID=UPI00272ABA7B|nr:hypothetical protein [Faecalibaculum rodentium]